MTYRGFVTRRTTQDLPMGIVRTDTAVFRGDMFMVFVVDDPAFIRRVIDQKIKEGRWPGEDDQQ